MKQNLQPTIERIGAILQTKDLMLVTAESCTGGWVAEVITSVPNASLYFERGFVTYSNAAKIEMLGIKQETLEKYGAVSEEVVQEMAEGAVKNSHAQVSLAITGIAGPSGGTQDKPVGMVCFGWKLPHHQITKISTQYFQGDRAAIRLQAVNFALVGLLALLNELG